MYRAPVAPGAPEVRLYESPVRLVVTDVEATAALSYVEGRAVPYNVATDTGWYYVETFAPGSLAASIRSHPSSPLLLWHESRAFPVGVADEWHDEADGLHGVWRLDDTADAQRAARSAAGGFLTGLSIAFAPVRSEWIYADWDAWDPEDPSTYDQVTRMEARLLETSLTSTPAYADAGVSLVRSAEGRMRTRRFRGADHPVPAPPRRSVPLGVPLARASAVHRTTPQLDKWRHWRSTLDPAADVASRP